MVLFGAAVTIYGVTIYYLLPLALMSMNLTLVSKIVIFILVGLLFSLTLLAFNIQSTVESICTKVFLCFEIKSVRSMVIKNLAAHRKRNQMTALIYSLALGFLIFLSISCRMQISVSSAEELKDRAAYFQVSTNARKSLHVGALEQILKANEHLIDDFTWVTAPVNNHEDAHLKSSFINDL